MVRLYKKGMNEEVTRMKCILALDIGVASVGWAIVDKETGAVLEAGSNIFPEASAAANQVRREMRQSKRENRRRRNRLDDFTKMWRKYGLPIPAHFDNDIVNLKVQALYENISLEELYMILYNYLKHRGISYLEDAQDDTVSGSSAYANGLKENAKALETSYPSEIQKQRLETLGKYRGQTQIVNDNGEKTDLSNVFTVSAYRKEIQAILTNQQKYHKELVEEICNEYIMIFNRKRKYYEGPGNEKSRTDYGKYTTQKDENGNYITENNIFEKLIGKCSIYKDELRASTASYTAQEFNLLNDLNNLTINGRKLEENEKRKIVETIKTSNTVNMRKIISAVMNEKIEDFQGARVDKSNKELFHKFEAYNKMRKALDAINIDITSFSREDLDDIAHILTLNTDKESIEEAFKNSRFNLPEDVRECFVTVRKNNSSLFSKWHSFSLKIMKEELIPEMYSQPKEQMALLVEKGFFKGSVEEFAGLTYIPVDAVSEDILNPVVRRSVRVSFKILNGILKKYKELEAVVIEMPRDRNSEEEKKRIADGQKMNEKEMEYIETKLVVSYGLKLSHEDFSSQKNLSMKLKLWNEQDGICLYSGRTIDPNDIVRHPEMFEIDHIIPRSISFDDSRSNKVLVYRVENQKKANRTPYFYLSHSNGEWTFEKFRATVMNLSKKKEYAISRKKVQNLLYSEDITKMDVLKGFINRNINDTSYASRVVLNTLQNFFKAKDTETKVKVVRGSYTHQMRVNMKLDKDRQESYSHHAVDAMLIAFSEMGYEAYRKLQGSFIDFETGEILQKEMWEENMTDEVYADYLYGMKWSQIRREITRAEKDVRFWHFVSRKCNRGLCNQTIRGTREYGGKIYKINKFDIRTKEGLKVFKKLAFSKKESDREKLLVYLNDRRTFDNLVQICEQYSDAENPFVQYEKETGDIVRKYAKKHNGPRIDKLKYKDGEVGACIDISHKYGHEKGSKKVILEKLVPYRTDVYYKKENDSYYLVGIKQSDIKFKNGVSVIDEEAYSRILVQEKMIKHGQTRANLDELGYIFKFSFYKNDIIEYEKEGEIFVERYLSRTRPQQKNCIELKPINKEKYESQKQIGIAKTKHIRKYRTDILGNRYACDKEEFSKYC